MFLTFSKNGVGFTGFFLLFFSFQFHSFLLCVCFLSRGLLGVNGLFFFEFWVQTEATQRLQWRGLM